MVTLLFIHARTLHCWNNSTMSSRNHHRRHCLLDTNNDDKSFARRYSWHVWLPEPIRHCSWDDTIFNYWHFYRFSNAGCCCIHHFNHFLLLHLDCAWRSDWEGQEGVDIPAQERAQHNHRHFVDGLSAALRNQRDSRPSDEHHVEHWHLHQRELAVCISAVLAACQRVHRLVQHGWNRT